MDLVSDSIILPSVKNRTLLSSTDNLHPTEQDLMSIESPVSKRYSLSQDIKNSFYAIRHLKENEEEEEQQQDTNENIIPSPSGKKPASQQQRGRKRLTNDTKTSHANQRKKQRPSSKSKTALYQTCTGIWPEQHTNDSSHHYIKSLSELVKIRLSQAKFKLLAQLDKDHALYACLAETLTTPASSLYHCTDKHRMHLIGKQNKSTLSVVGSSKNLFARNKRRLSSTTVYTDAIFVDSPHSVTPMEEDGLIASPFRQTDHSEYHTSHTTKTTKDRKKRTPKTNTKPRRVTTPKRRSAAADVAPVTLSDGSSVYVCEPCHKKYKNRNGLAYHLERCKNRSEKESMKDSSQTSSSQHPVTTTSHRKEEDADGDDEEEEEDDEEDEDSESERHQIGKDLLQSLLEAQANDRLLANKNHSIAQASSSFSQFNNELFNSPSVIPQEETDQTDSQMAQETVKKDEEEEGEDEFSVHTHSSNLHIWEDFNLNSGFEQTQQQDAWKLPDEELTYDDLPSSSWQMNDINLFSQPPSLLFSDTTLNSTIEDTKPLLDELTSDIISCETPHQTPQSTPDGGLWFQFANFDDDYQQK
ncbi:hypothetical protein BD560DRAFT_487952 [Blakeslea trispora]|nr:hypothetical protein BD560DRAFT_487952 [Blakeslea trispora]